MGQQSGQIFGPEEDEAYYHSVLRHDLSNKNQIILGYLEILMDTNLNSEQREMIDLAYRAVIASNELIKIIQKMHQALEPRELHPIDLDKELNVVISEFSSEFKQNQITVQQLPIEATIIGDELTREIFVNIIGNTIVHSGATTLAIKGEIQPTYVRLQIMDNGKGIPEHLRSLIFSRRCKGSESTGSGLGLLLAKTIVKTQGGTIELQNQDCKGTCIVLRFPHNEDKLPAPPQGEPHTTS
jgi:signal transduction histidine kinase